MENLFLRRKEKVLFFLKEAKEKDFPDLENEPSKVEKETIMIMKMKKNNIINNQRMQNHIKKRKNNIQNKNTIIRYYILINLIKFIKINIFCLIKSNIFYNLYSFQSSKITLELKGIGNHSLFGYHYRYDKYNFSGINYLKEIKINGQEQETNKYKYKYYFEQEINIVELIWDKNLSSCANMFRDCCNITEIDLSKFDTSNIISMNNMFSGCYSLT